MGHKTLARNRAMGVIGRGRVEAVEAAGVAFVDTAEQEKLVQRRAELEAENKRLRNEVEAARVPREAMVQ